jgi:hypothetical protein
MVIIPAMWMDETMTQVDPNLWGPYQALVTANREEYEARQQDEMSLDAQAFVDTYKQYRTILTDADRPVQDVGRVFRGLDTQLNRSLRVPFDRNIKSAGDNIDTYEIFNFDPKTQGADQTQLVFNTQTISGGWRLTSSFECTVGAAAIDKIHNDGWYGDGVLSLSSDIPANLPAFAFEPDGTPVYGQKSLSIVAAGDDTGFAARRLLLRDGKYALSFWVKTTNSNVGGPFTKVAVIRNTRQEPKGQWMVGSPPTVPGDRVTSVEHFRNAYETVAEASIREIAGWKQYWINFELVDHYKVSEEEYPPHEVYIVVESDNVLVDHFNLLTIASENKLSILNTINRSTMDYTLRPELRHVDLEKAFSADTPVGTTERSASAFRFDGRYIACELDSKPGYNIHSTGTTINSWFKINSDDEATNQVLMRRSGFTLFQKTGVNVPGYSCTVDLEKKLIFTVGNQRAFDSSSCLNHFLHPAVSGANTLPKIDWSDPNQYENYHQAYNLTGQQPTESYSLNVSPGNTIGLKVTTDLDDRKYNNIGYGKSILVRRLISSPVDPADDPYPFGSDGLYLYGGQYQTTEGVVETALPGEAVDFNQYMNWHQNEAYSQVVPARDLAPGDSRSGFIFSPPPLNTYLDPGLLTSAMLRRYPLLLAGVLQFDRWFNFDFSYGPQGVKVSINGSLVYSAGSLTLPVSENGDRLIIGTANSDAINQSSPISVYSFKIFQRQNNQDDCINIVSGESTNFNDAQYQIFRNYLDFDYDKVLDFWQEDMSDLGLKTVWPSVFYSPHRDPDKAHGQVIASGPDPIMVRVDYDKNRTLIADWYDELYLQSLVDAETIGFQDALIFQDFANRDQDAVHGYSDRYWDPTCRKYVSRSLSYYDWLISTVTSEVNSIVAITDEIPTAFMAGSPQPDPSPIHSPWPPAPPYASFGEKDDQLLMTGVKGWFGYSGLLGYRDSLDLVRQEGIIFNYLQVEFHFRAQRTVLEALLEPYAKDIGQLFRNEIRVGHK